MTKKIAVLTAPFVSKLVDILFTEVIDRQQ